MPKKYLIQDHMDIVQNVMDSLGAYHTFDIYDKDDIKQEIYILCAGAIEAFDDEQSDLYSYLYNFCKLRLLNFKRDNYINTSLKNVESQVIAKNPSSLSHYDTEDKLDNDLQSMFRDFDHFIDNKIMANVRANYLRLKEGVDISYSDKTELLNIIKKIVESHTEEEDGI